MSAIKKNAAFDAALGARIKEARLAAVLSQTQIGERVGVSFQQIRKYEVGQDRISVEMLLKIAAALGLSHHRFLDDELGRLAPLVEVAAPPSQADTLAA